MPKVARARIKIHDKTMVAANAILTEDGVILVEPVHIESEGGGARTILRVRKEFAAAIEAQPTLDGSPFWVSPMAAATDPAMEKVMADRLISEIRARPGRATELLALGRAYSTLLRVCREQVGCLLDHDGQSACRPSGRPREDWCDMCRLVR